MKYNWIWSEKKRYKNHTSMHIFRKKNIPFKMCKITVAYTDIHKNSIHNWIIILEKKRNKIIETKTYAYENKYKVPR